MKPQLSVYCGLLIMLSFAGCCMPVPTCLRHPADRCRPTSWLCVTPPQVCQPWFGGSSTCAPVCDTSCCSCSECGSGCGEAGSNYTFSGSPTQTHSAYQYQAPIPQPHCDGCGESYSTPRLNTPDLFVPPEPQPWSGDAAQAIDLSSADASGGVRPAAYTTPAAARQPAAQQTSLPGHRVTLRQLQ